MALVLKDRVQETATPNTTVSFSCNGPVTGFQAFSVIGNGNTTYYTAVDGSGNWESGLGTYTTAGSLLARTTISASSNAGSAVTFSGTVNLFVSYPATKSVNLDASGNVSPLGTVASGTWQGSTVGVAYGGTGLTTFTTDNNAIYSTSSSALAAGTLPVLAGGTGVTTSTGTGSTVLSAGPTFTGTLNAANISYTGTLTGGTGVVAIGTSQIYKDASGNVGVGTSSPSVYGQLVSQKVFNGTAVAASFNNISNVSANTVVAVDLWADQARSRISSNRDGAGTSSSLLFSTSLASTLTEAMRIDSSGNVGIGTSSPPSQLTVSGIGQLVAAITDAGSKLGTVQIHSPDGNAGAGGALLLSALSSGTTTPQWAIKALLTSGGGNGRGDLAISRRINVADTSLTEAMRITAAGGVNIGATTDPGLGNLRVAGANIVGAVIATSAAAPTIASATTIAPTKAITFISGTTAIINITAPSPISLGGGQITLIPTGIFTTTTAGNIALASTAIVSKALIMTYDVTTAKWYPSY